jgi:hypothetical protein
VTFLFNNGQKAKVVTRIVQLLPFNKTLTPSKEVTGKTFYSFME